MPKRYKMKVEVEFECPATVPPEQAFGRFFDADRKVENDKIKVISHELFTTPSKINPKLRAHNEARRVMQVLIDQSGIPFKIIKGNRYSHWNTNEATSQFHLYLEPSPQYPNSIGHHWVQITGKYYGAVSDNRKINLSDPNSHIAVAQELKCAFWICDHNDKSNHK